MNALADPLTVPVEKLADVDAHEGAVVAGGALYFTSVPRHGVVTIRRLDLASLEVTTPVPVTRRANGMTLSADGSLLVCEQGTFDDAARIARLDLARGTSETVVDTWRGLPFNSPNDVVEASDGAIWFTDPSYGYLQGFRPAPQSGDYVYRHDPATGRTSVVADGFDKPNGLAFSPDERVLYVGDSEGPHHVVAFDVVGGRRLADERLFAVITPGYPDGIKVDRAGRVYVSSRTGVQVFSPEGDELGEIPVPNAVQFAFAGERLLVLNDSAVWSAGLKGAF
jgi:gluconolactonase